MSLLRVGVVGLAALVLLASLMLFVRSGDAMILVFGLVGLSWLAIVLAVVSVLARPDLTGPQRLAWLAVVVFVSPVVPVGAIAYFAMGRERTRGLFRDLGGAPPSAPPPT